MINHDLEQRVWQRVAEPSSPSLSLEDLFFRCLCREKTFLRLSARASTETARKLRYLAGLEREEGDCLRGLLGLKGLRRSRKEAQSFPGGTSEALLLLYRDILSCCTDYSALSLNLQTGAVFSFLAGKKQEQAALIMGLYGQMVQISEKIQK